MTSRARLRLLTWMLPAVLGWLGVLGEWNRARDRSDGASISVAARAILGTSYSGPRIVFAGEIFREREVGPAEYPQGADVLLRFRRDGEEWTFENVRRASGQEWSGSRIDLPARIRAAGYPSGAARAVPLVPASFAVSRATISRIRRGTHVVLTVRRGALGNVWIAAARETGESLGMVTSLWDGPEGPVAFGSGEERLDPRTFASPEVQGWASRVSRGKLESIRELPGRPIASMQLPGGRWRVLVHGPMGGRGFDLLDLGPDLVPAGAVRHFGGEFFSFATDGSIWTFPSPVDRRSGQPIRIVRQDPAGDTIQEIAWDRPGTPAALLDDVVISRTDGGVARCVARREGLTETDHWTLEGLVGAFPQDRETVVAVTSKSVLRLTTGASGSQTLFATDVSQRILSVHGDPSGNLMVTTLPTDFRPTPSVPLPRERLWLVPAGGARLDLGERPIRPNDEFEPDSGDRCTAAGRHLIRSGILYFAAGTEILLFDARTGQRAGRIAQRTAGSPRRIL